MVHGQQVERTRIAYDDGVGISMDWEGARDLQRS